MKIRNRIFRIVQEIVLFFSKRKKNVVIIFVPGTEFFSGGILALFYLYKESVKVLNSGDNACFVCSLPYDNNILRYKESGKGVMILNYFSVLRKYRNAEKIMLFVGESFVWQVNRLKDDKRQQAIDKNKVHINVLNMNMELMPPPAEVQKLRQLTNSLTVTAAHVRYTRTDFTQPYGMEFTHLCAWVIESERALVPFAEKKDIMLVAHDPHEMKDAVLEKIKADFPVLEIVKMYRMRFEDYLEFQSKVKWTLTFGEGPDGYFNGAIFTGGMGIAAYNSVFFTEDYIGLPNIFKSYEDLYENVSTFIKKFNNTDDYSNLHKVNLDIIEKYASPEMTNRQLKELYRDKHGFTLKKE